MLALIALLSMGSLYSMSDAQIRLPSPPKIPGIDKPKPPPSNSGNPSGEAPNGESWFSALARFRRGYDPSRSMSEDRAKFISPYLACYAKKHGLDQNKVGSYYRSFDGVSQYEIKNVLKNELPELAKLENEFKKMFPSRPNNGKSIDDNPAIWDDIFTNREAYYQCAVADMPEAGNCDQLSSIDKVRMESHMEHLNELLEQVKTFTVSRGWYSGQQHEDYFMAAISPKRRAEMQKSTKYGPFFKCFEPLLDEIQTETKKTLPNYTLSAYNTRSPADERILRSAINDLNSATVFKIGLGSAVWNIQKNALGIPEKRYKHGAIWVKYPNVDHGFCQILWINVIQDYAGGGTYGQSYGYFTRNEPAGCPAGK